MPSLLALWDYPNGLHGAFKKQVLRGLLYPAWRGLPFTMPSIIFLSVFSLVLISILPTTPHGDRPSFASVVLDHGSVFSWVTILSTKIDWHSTLPPFLSDEAWFRVCCVFRVVPGIQ